MTVRPVPQLIDSLRDVLKQVGQQTKPESLITDHSSNTKLSCSSWIETAEATRAAAQKLTPEVTHLEHLILALKYRIHLLKDEAPLTDIDPLMAKFDELSKKLFLDRILKKFAEDQISYLARTYPSFFQKLLEPDQEELAVRFFKFCLQAPLVGYYRGRRVSHWVDIFVQYPEVVERMMRSSFYEKLGQYPDRMEITTERDRLVLKMDLKDGAQMIPVNESWNIKLPLKNKAAEPSGIVPPATPARMPLSAPNPPTTAKKGLVPPPTPARHTQTPAKPPSSVQKTGPQETSAGLSLSLEEIFNQFETTPHPDVDVSADGIINLNTRLLVSRVSEKKVDYIDATQWTEYCPSVKFSWEQLIKLYPEAQKGTDQRPPFGFVLRAHSSSPKKGEAFFDFILKEPDGNYLVFSFQGYQLPDAALYQQKRAFYPLTEEQGAVVVRKIAEEIQRAQQAHAEGKSIPPLDIQSYIDEVLGYDFYENLRSLIEDLHPSHPHQTKEELLAQLAQVKVNLDTADFEKFLKPIMDNLVNHKRDITKVLQFIEISLKTIHSALQLDPPELPKKEQVTAAAAQHSDQVTSGLVALASLCFEVLHPFRMTVAAAEKDTPVWGYLFQKIENISWGWLKNLLYALLLTLLGKRRGYHYKTLVSPELTDEQKKSWRATRKDSLKKWVKSVSNIKPERYLNRVSQLFSSLSDEEKRSITARLHQQMSVLALPVQDSALFQSAHPQQPPQ